MAPATMTEPNSVSNEEDSARQRNIPTSLELRSPERTENESNVNNLSPGTYPQNYENTEDSVFSGTCTPRTPITNPLKTFRFVRKGYQSGNMSEFVELYFSIT